MQTISVDGRTIRTHAFNTIIVGTGAAGLNAAGQLHRLGQADIALLTEGVKLGTSRNTGSDKQTYYRQTISGAETDSIEQMAQTLFAGGCMDGDLALCEAANSARCFFHLAELGVPFPHNRYGEFVGYKTDHDPCKRGASAGPLTSKFMTECLLKDVQTRQIPIFDGVQVIELLTEPEGNGSRTVGVLALDLARLESPDERYVLFLAENVVYATGGEAGMYKTSVYPMSQTGGTGTVLRAGALAKNLTESQYGIASIKFRWNLSGTYQQVIPRYVSTDCDGNDPRAFMDSFFTTPGKMLDAIFLKGYQWPFDPRKLADNGSSLIDLLVYNETVIKGRRVFLDFTQNPACGERDGRLDFTLLGTEAHEYLANSGALQVTPIERLAHMNQPAIDLYRRQGIDLATELLEIGVCAQHNNGGLSGNLWWESNIRHLFPVGEVNGSHGVYRPGGSALNSGQVGSLRASQYIAQNYTGAPHDADALQQQTREQLAACVAQGERWLTSGEPVDPIQLKHELGERMSRFGAHIRSLDGARQAGEQAHNQLVVLETRQGAASAARLAEFYRVRDLLVSQITYLGAIANYIAQGGGSRGSYLIHQPDGQLPAAGLPQDFRFRLDGDTFAAQVQETLFDRAGCRYNWRPVRALPQEEQWFETVWKDYLEQKIIR